MTRIQPTRIQPIGRSLAASSLLAALLFSGCGKATKSAPPVAATPVYFQVDPATAGLVWGKSISSASPPFAN